MCVKSLQVSTYSQTGMFLKDLHTHNLPLVDPNLTTEHLNWYCNNIANI